MAIKLYYFFLNHFLQHPEPTRILTQPEYKVVQRGMSAAFQCKVKHDPSLIPTMTWLKDSGELPDDERYKNLEHQDYEINLIHVNTYTVKKQNKEKCIILL